MYIVMVGIEWKIYRSVCEADQKLVSGETPWKGDCDAILKKMLVICFVVNITFKDGYV